MNILPYMVEETVWISHREAFRAKEIFLNIRRVQCVHKGPLSASKIQGSQSGNMTIKAEVGMI